MEDVMMPAAGTDTKSLISAWKKTNEQELFTNLKTDYGFSQALARSLVQLMHGGMWDLPIPMFTSDNWDPFEEGLLSVYGFLETPVYCGIGRKPDQLLVPYPNLKYAKVCKKRKNGRLVEIIHILSVVIQMR
jgi:hypothetical protein